jgi:hypothetical protein
LQFNDLRGWEFAGDKGQQLGSDLPAGRNQHYLPSFRCQLSSSPNCSGPPSVFGTVLNLFIGIGPEKHKPLWGIPSDS